MFMSNRVKIAIAIFLVAATLIVGFTYYQTVVQQTFDMIDHVP